MFRHTTRRTLLATIATAATVAATAPAASGMPVDNGKRADAVPVKLVRVQVDEGLDWGDAGIGAAGMLALVLVGFGGAHALAAPASGRERSAARS
jgi:hypothetical protein